MPRTYRKKLFPNIYEDDSGYEIIVTRKGRTNPPARYKKPKTLQYLKGERERLIYDLEQHAARTAPGTLRADAKTALLTLPEGRPKQDREWELAPWLAVWGDWQRSQLTPQIIRGQIAQWQTEGVAASTINHRRQALRWLWLTLDGPDAPTPVDRIPKLSEPREIRAIPRAAVLAILRRVQPNKSGARIKVIARIGLPHAQVKKLKPSDVDLVSRAVYATPRRKGAGTKPRTLPITRAAARALTLFARVEAWGPFSNSSLYKAFQLAVTKARAKWPEKNGPWPARPDLRPYDLRHAFGTEVYRSTRDLRATAELMMHSNLSTTARYAEAAVSDTASAARDALERPRLALTPNRPK